MVSATVVDLEALVEGGYIGDYVLSLHYVSLFALSILERDEEENGSSSALHLWYTSPITSPLQLALDALCT